MFRICLIILAVLGPGEAMGQPAEAETRLAQFGGMETAWDAQISPQGDLIAIGCSPRGHREICVYSLDDDAAPQLVPAPDGARIVNMQWAGDNHLVFTVRMFRRLSTSRGMLRVRYTRLLAWNSETQSTSIIMREWRGASLGGLTTLASRLSDQEDTIAIQILFTNSSSNDQMGSSEWESGLVYQSRVYTADLNSGRDGERFLHSGSESVYEYVLDARGGVHARVVIDNRSRTYSILRGEDDETVLFTGHFPIHYPYVGGLVDENTGLVIRMPDDRGIQRLDLASGELSGFGPAVSDSQAIMDPHTGQVVGFRIFADDTLLPETRFLFDADLEGTLERLRPVLNASSVMITSWSADRQRYVIETQESGQPHRYFLFERATRSLSELASENDWLEGVELPQTRVIAYPARDGLTIPALLTLPPAHQSSATRPPLIVMPHGGPASRDVAVYDWQASALAMSGYAVLQPNFRGSIGYGLAHEEAGYGEYGGAMIDDMIDGARFLAAEGLTTSNYCAVGGSYGGYAALMMALNDAEHVQCVVAFAAVTDPLSLINHNRSRSLDYWERYLGTRSSRDTEGVQQSPVQRAREFSQPILLLHGREDYIVNPRQSEWLWEEARRTADIEYIRMDEQNHYLDTQTARSTWLGETDRFLAEHFPVPAN